MTRNKSNETRIQDLAVVTVRQGRDLADRISKTCDVPFGKLSRPAIAAILQRLETGEVTAEGDVAAFESLKVNLAERMSLEIVGSELESAVIGYNEDGEIWSWVRKPVYSDRGEQAHTLYKISETRYGPPW